MNKITQLIEAMFGRPAGPNDVALSTKKWGVMNMNELSKSCTKLGFRRQLLDPNEQQKLIDEAHQQFNIDFSYGGYLENRAILLRDSYLPPDGMIHLGIDFNVPAGTPIGMPASGRCVFAVHDKDQIGGWGGRVDFCNDDLGVYFILGHLDPMAALHTQGVWLGKGITVGFIGNRNVNGGWFPHLHLQVVSKAEYERHSDPMQIDGYGRMSADLRERYPNPEILVR